MIERAARAAKKLVDIMSLEDEAAKLLEEWLLFSEGALDEKQSKWLYERTETFVTMV